MKKALLITFLAFALYGCRSGKAPDTITIADVSVKSEHVFKAGVPNINRLKISITGEIDGLANVIVKSNYHYSKEYEIPDGKVRRIISCDWYENYVLVENKPITAAKGQLVIACKFL